MVGWRRDLIWTLAAFLLMVGLTWPLALHPSERLLSGPFGPSILVSFEMVPEAIWSGQDPHLSSELGAPFERKARYLGWVLLLLAVPLKFLGPVRLGALVTLASPALAVLTMARLLRARAPESSAGARGLASFTFAFAPFYMSNMANGELAKAQAWLLPLALLLAWRLRQDWRMLPILAGVLLLTGFTSPYLLACVGLALAVDGLCGLRHWRRYVPVGAVLLAVLALVSLAYEQDGKSHEWLFSPTHRPELSTPTELVAPYAVAPLSGLLWPKADMTPSGLQHGIYLCWSVLLVALWGFWKKRGVALAWTIVGVLCAMGPVLFLTPTQLTGVPLPMALVEPFGTGLSTSGMYYRLLQVGLVGLALGVSRAPLPQWSWLPLSLVFAVEVILAQGSALPLPTQALPHAELAQRIAEDPLPGSVLDLPGWPVGETNRPHAMAFRLAHGRAVTALPRMPKHPVEYNLCLKLLDRCVDRRSCRVPAQTLERFEDRGVRFVVLHTDQGHDTESLERALRESLGTPENWPQALLWQVFPDPTPSQEWSCGPTSGNLASPPDVR